MDWVVVALLALAFGTLATSHLALCIGLVSRAGPWRAFVAFVVPPLAPFWGFSQGMRIRSVFWGLGLAVYIGSFIAAL